MKRISYRAKSLAVASRKRAECQSRDEVEKQSTCYRETRSVHGYLSLRTSP